METTYKFNYFEETYAPNQHIADDTYWDWKLTSSARISFVGSCAELSDALETL